MDQHALLMHTLMRHTQLESLENARHREHLLWLERTTREARRRRRRERVRRAWNACVAAVRVRRDRVGGPRNAATGALPPSLPLGNRGRVS
jgi:hypothetical protein